MSNLETLLERKNEFPTLPEVADRITRKLSKGDWNVDAVVKLIGLDASLSARILRMANSVLIGARSQSTSVRDAVMRLGAQVTRDTVVTASLMDALPELPAPLSVRSYWSLGLSSAMMSRRVASDLKLADAELAYLAGLVHCVGETYLALFHTESFRKAVKRWQDDGGDLSAALEEEFGCPVQEVSAGLLESWAFPPAVIEAVRWCARPTLAPSYADLAGVVFVADLLCHDLGLGLAPPPVRDEAWIECAPASLVERLAESGYPDLTFYLLELQEDIDEVESFARSVFVG